MDAVEHGFKAEVQQLLNLMIHSVYSDREVFLRELISNAADALDKVRFLGLTQPDLVPAGHDTPAIRITVDEQAHTISLDDDGVGMTKDEAVENLGTIAHSGTKAFLEKLKESGDQGAPELIGQFGLGFYSAFMVADRVEVVTRSAQPGSEPVRWTSGGEGTYTIEPGEREARGTRITLHLRDDAHEFAAETRLRSIVRKHSNFLPWPIHVGEDQANTGKALWVEPPSQVSDEEASAFYKSVTMDWQDPARRIHLSVDSPLQYHAMLFVPRARPFDLFYPDGARGPRLYARRVLIEEQARDLLPEWLRFVRGVVDSEDISLNVSREMVQKTAVVRKISDALTKRILKDLVKWAEEPPPEADSQSESESEVDESPATYADFWKNFGMLLKEGYYHARSTYGEQLLPLLRFNSTAHDDEAGLMSLAEYKAAMPEGQDTIWYLTAESREAALASPHLEAFRKRGWSVLLLTDAVDEWLVTALDSFEEVPLKSIARGELELELEDDEDDADKADLTEFAPWMKELLGDKVVEVRASSRLTDSAVVLVDAEDGISANMERLLRESQQNLAGMSSKRILELNPKHPLIRNLAELRDSGRADAAAELASMLYDDAMLLEGTVQEPAALGRRLQELLLRASAKELD